jgi:hypothetical protein
MNRRLPQEAVSGEKPVALSPVHDEKAYGVPLGIEGGSKRAIASGARSRLPPITPS